MIGGLVERRYTPNGAAAGIDTRPQIVAGGARDRADRVSSSQTNAVEADGTPPRGRCEILENGDGGAGCALGGGAVVRRRPPPRARRGARAAADRAGGEARRAAAVRPCSGRFRGRSGA